MQEASIKLSIGIGRVTGRGRRLSVMSSAS